MPFTAEDLWKPNPQLVQKVFELFAELLMNITRETVEPAMRAAAEEVGTEYLEVIPIDTRNLMGFYVSLRKLLIEVPCISSQLSIHTDLPSVASQTSPSPIY